MRDFKKNICRETRLSRGLPPRDSMIRRPPETIRRRNQNIAEGAFSTAVDAPRFVVPAPKFTAPVISATELPRKKKVAKPGLLTRAKHALTRTLTRAFLRQSFATG